MEAMPPEALEGDGVRAGIRAPDRNHRAPRGLVRGLGAPAAAAAAAADSAAGQQSSDQLAEDLRRLSLGEVGAGQGGQKELLPAADTSRPEVQVRVQSRDKRAPSGRRQSFRSAG